MLESLRSQLYARGRQGPPEKIKHKGSAYQLIRILKHDFFAATALYQLRNEGKAPADNPPKVVLKLGRKQHFLGLPLGWLGRIICRHEMSILNRLSELDQVPRIISNYGENGFIYGYIEGESLEENTTPPDDFFDRLIELLNKIHRHRIVYLDMDKRSNIIIGEDSRPYFIDFQISLYIDGGLPVVRKITDYLRQNLQRFDLYHLYKHKRKLRPELLKPHERVFTEKNSFLKLHRRLATPLRRARRRLLNYLNSKDRMTGEEHI